MIKITKDTKDTKREGEAGAGRACAQGARPARGPVGHGGLRTPCFGEGGGAAGPPRRTENGERRTERPTSGRRMKQRAEEAKLPSL